MGGKQSMLTEKELEVYQELTGLNQAEILHAYKKFFEIDPLAFSLRNRKGRISCVTVAENLAELKVNPFRYRICTIFTSDESGFMDFDDFLDMISVMNPKTNLYTKLEWAFQIYDFNEDDVLCHQDLNTVLDLLTGGIMEQTSKDQLIEHILWEADSDCDGVISLQEFERTMALHSGPEFVNAFSFRL